METTSALGGISLHEASMEAGQLVLVLLLESPTGTSPSKPIVIENLYLIWKTLGNYMPCRARKPQGCKGFGLYII